MAATGTFHRQHAQHRCGGHLADHVVVMNRGRIEKSGPAAVVLHQPQADFTRLLLAAVPRIDTVAAF